MCRPPSRPPTPGPLMCLPMPLCATPAEVPSKILRLRRAWQCAMVVVVDVSWRRAADVTTHLHQQLFPSPAAPEDRCLSAPMRNGTLSEGGLATACVTVTRGLLGVSLPAAPLPRCYSPAHIRPPACLSMSLCASPLRSLRMTPPAAGQQNVVADVVPVDVGLLPRCGCHTTGCSIRSRHTAHAHARGPFWGPVHQPLHLRMSAGAVDRPLFF